MGFLYLYDLNLAHFILPDIDDAGESLTTEGAALGCLHRDVLREEVVFT
jgi:hypothetical protein